MAPKTFYILDVFAEQKYAGNQLAVIRGGGQLSQAEMQQIALEMNYSETTFIMSETEMQGGFDVRIFTPKTELPFAGHPTLGTAWVIQREILGEPVDKVTLNLGVGKIPVTFTDEGILWMKQVEPEFDRPITALTMSGVLSLDEEDIDEKFASQKVSTGFFSIIVPVKSLDAVKRARIDRALHDHLIENTGPCGILVFCPEPVDSENTLHARFFADALGVPEDPATGSANGCLAGWLVKHRYFGSDSIDIKVEQGYEMGRPSILYLKASESDSKIDVNVGGKVVMVAKGELV
ncbi:PhzF family phenazine biosynthesis protein [bacterium]|nr:PhzF family phenazine biosynthesis protein [bacterium]MBU1651686.1 PhzF family phenazine biosynthesis protein [bacterium]